jgi:hypothetical protein
MDWINVPAVKMTDLDDEVQYDDTSEIIASATSSINKLVNKDDILDFCSNSKKIEAITLHHTWSPDSSQYRGRSTILGIKRYHIQNVGAKDIMANFYTSPVDDYIGWTARPLNIKNGAHAYISKNWNQVPADLKKRASGNKQFLNYKSIGIETVANMDAENPATNKSMRNSIKLIAILCEIYNLDIDKDLYFHRDAASKSCPGNLVTKSFVQSEVKKEMGNGEDCNEIDCKDKTAHNYAKPALEWAVENGLIKGDANGNLMPRCPITREDFIVILKRYDDFLKKD